MIRFGTFLCLLLAISAKVDAQVDAFTAARHVVIKFSPLPLFDLDNTVQFGVEIPLGTKGLSLQQDLGYGNEAMNGWYEDQNAGPDDKQTFKSRTNLRYYYFQRKRVRGYVGGEVMLKQVLYRDTQWVGMDCADGSCNFREERDLKIVRHAAAGHVKFGWQFYFDSRMTIDLFTGIGFRSIAVKELSGKLENARYSRIGEFWEMTTPGDRAFVPSFAGGVHFGFVLGKFRR